MRKTLMVVLALVVVLAVAIGSASIVVGGKPTKTPVTGVELNQTGLDLDVGQTGTLQATITPPDAFNQRVKWSTSNRAVAKLSGHGLTRTITGVQAGNATVTVTTVDGTFNATCFVTVQIPLISIRDIIGAPVVGQTLLAGALSPADATATYQWQRADASGGSYSNVEGATGSTYQLIEADWQKYFMVVATGYGFYKGNVTSNPTSQVKLPLTSIGAISGTTEVLETLTAGALTPAEATVTYQWQRSVDGTSGWMNISGGNSNTYNLAPADWQMYIRVSATGTGLYTGTVTSEPTGQITSTGIALTSIDDISGDPIVEETLHAGALTPEDATADYQWQWSSNNITFSDIPGGTSTDFSLNETAWQKYIRVAATGYGLYKDTVYSQPTSMVLMLVDYIYDPDEAPVVGVTLTAGDYWPVGATVSYQWQSNNGTGWVDIAGATGNTYVVSEDDLAKYIQVTATGTGVYTGTVASGVSTGGIGPVTTQASLDYIAPIAGISMAGQTLTAGALDPKGATADYQWQRSDDGYTYVDIEGANASTYQLVEADSGKYIQVTANGTGVYVGTVTADPQDGAVAVLGEPVSLPFVEDFSSYDWYSLLPAGWGYVYSPMIPDYDNMLYMSGTATAGGSSPELYFYYGDYETRYYDYRAITPAINTTGAISLALSFKHTHDFHRADLPYSIAVEVSTNGTDWDTVWEISPVTGDIAAETVGPINLDSYAGETIYLSWHMYGYTWWSNSWAIDDVAMTGVTVLTGIGPISGTPEVGQTLTAGNLTPPGATVTYQWQRCDTAGGNYTDISGATSNTYDLVAVDLGCYIKVAATGTGAYTGTVTSAATAQVASPSLTPLTGIGPISGTPVVRQTLTAGALSPAGATATYQWQRSDIVSVGYADISGATSSSYVLHVADYQKYIRVVATGSGVYTGTVTSSATAQIGGVVLTGIGAINGTPEVGQTLTAGALSPAGATATYQWWRMDTAEGSTGAMISEANSTSYVLVVADLGYYIRVEVTGTNEYIGQVISEATAQVTAATGELLTGIGAITGNPTVWSTLTAGALTPGNATATYQWKSCDTVDGAYTDISGATSNFHILVAADFGKYIKVWATGTGSYAGTVTSEATSQVAAAPLNWVEFDGQAVVGLTLSAVVSPPGAAANYQWKGCNTSDGNYTDISGATGSTYVVAAGDLGRYIKVTATGTGMYSGEVTSSSPDTVGSQATLDLLEMDGPNVVTATLTTYFEPDDATLTFQWQRCDTVDGTYADISGATSDTYVLVEADLDKYIRLKVEGTGIYSGVSTSEPIGPIGATTNLGWLGPITGIPAEGKALTISAPYPLGATADYQWQRCDTWDGTGANISGATSNTYVVVAADVGKYLRVKATGTGVFTGEISSTYAYVSAAMPLPFAEDFTVVYEDIPTGWAQIYDVVTSDHYYGKEDSASAGGTSPQLHIQYWHDRDASVDYRISTPAINTAAATSTLNLSFKHVHYLYGPERTYSIAVEVSTDGGTTWTPTPFVYSPVTGSIGPETVNINLDAYAGQTIMISWRYYGYAWNSDGWYLDDIVVSGS